MIDVSNFNMTDVYPSIPDVKHLRFDNVEDFTKEKFELISAKLLSYKGLESLSLELTKFELKEVQDIVVNILKNHRDTLKRISFAKNELSNEFFKAICNEMKELNVIEYIDLKHLKKVNLIDWVEVFKTINTLNEGKKKKGVTLSISQY